MDRNEILAEAKQLLEDFDEGKLNDIVKFTIKAGQMRALLSQVGEEYVEAFDKAVSQRLEKAIEILEEQPNHPLTQNYKKAQQRKYLLGIALTAFAHFPKEFHRYVLDILPFGLKVYNDLIRETITKLKEKKAITEHLLMESMYEALDDKGLLRGFISYLKSLSVKPYQEYVEELDKFVDLIFTNILTTDEDLYDEINNYLDQYAEEIKSKAERLANDYVKKKIQKRFGINLN
jgi:hypothetical protein